MRENIIRKSRDLAAALYHLPETKKIEKRYEYFCRSYMKKENLFSEKVLKYVANRKKGIVQYGFSESADESSLYSSMYACLIKSLYTELEEEEKTAWTNYFNSCQREDGLFEEIKYDSENYYNKGGGWGVYHLVPHLTIAYDRIKAIPKYEFSYLNKLKSPDDMLHWLRTLNYRKVWASSNEIMNYGVAMQYARDRMGMNFNSALDAMEDFLIKNINSKYGMWFEGEVLSKKDRNEMIRGAYHILPILYYDKIETPFAEFAIEQIMEAQNKWGGFDTRITSSACEDIDGLDTLLRLAMQMDLKDNILLECVEKARRWILFNQNKDGSFVFERDRTFSYGNQKLLSSEIDEGNLFATWFRCVSMEMIENYINGVNKKLMRTPGYECPL